MAKNLEESLAELRAAHKQLNEADPEWGPPPVKKRRSLLRARQARVAKAFIQ